MQSLLRWSIENSTPLDGAAADHPPVRKDLDPGIIDMILGKPDAELMKDAMSVAVDASRPERDRIEALDNLEMLIEQIDNANNLAKLNMWKPLHSLLTSEQSTPEIQMQALWVIGTALQNNPSAQDAYFEHTTNPLPTLVSFLVPSPSSTLQTRSKAIYTLSGLLKHNAPAVNGLDSPGVDGWAKLRNALQDPEITVRRKTMFLLGTLLLPTTPIGSPSSEGSNLHTPATQPIYDNSHAAHLHNPSRTSTSQATLEAFHAHKIPEAIVSSLTSPFPLGEDGDMLDADEDFEEKGVKVLYTYIVVCNGELPQQDKHALKAWLEEEKNEGGEMSLVERWNLDKTELAALTAKIA